MGKLMGNSRSCSTPRRVFAHEFCPLARCDPTGVYGWLMCDGQKPSPYTDPGDFAHRPIGPVRPPPEPATLRMTTVLPYISNWKEDRPKIDLVAVATELYGEAPGRDGRRNDGKHFWWLCPFHDDTNPSLLITLGKVWFRCLSCDEWGDAVKLVFDSSLPVFDVSPFAMGRDSS
jgi:hypothetical protein